MLAFELRVLSSRTDEQSLHTVFASKTAAAVVSNDLALLRRLHERMGTRMRLRSVAHSGYAHNG